MKCGIEFLSSIEDPLVLAGVANIVDGYESLLSLTERLYPHQKSLIAQFPEDIASDKWHEQCAIDCWNTLRCRAKLTQMLSIQGVQRRHLLIEMKLIQILSQMEFLGIGVHLSNLRSYQYTVEPQIEALQKELNSIAGSNDINANSAPVCSLRFASKLSLLFHPIVVVFYHSKFVSSCMRHWLSRMKA